MKKILAVLGASALLFASIFVTSCAQAAEGDTFYATTTIGTPDVTAKAYPGVNILTWKEIKDAGSYTIYRTVGNGKIEEAKKSNGNVYIDTDIDENVNYKYRIVANPVDAVSHDASQTEVSLKTAKIATDPNNVRGTWAPEGTPFLDLAKYESDYDSGAPVLSEATIDAKLITSDKNSVRVSFPVKPYATYKVYIDSENSSEPASSKEINGYDYNGTATVTLDAASGTNLVVVVATPLNTTYYPRSEVAALAAVSVSAKWTNYKSETKTANARIWFNPDAYGARTYSTDEYTVYRTVYKTMDSLVKSDEKTVDCNSVKLGTPKKDTEVEVNELPVYYYDDSLDITGVAAVRYYVILNHNGELKTRTSRLLIVGSADPDWNFTPYTPATPVTNEVAISDIYIEDDGIFYVKPYDYYSGTLSVTYGTFDTLNEAKVAVESELPNSLTLVPENNNLYKGIAVNTDKFYAIRVLSKKDNVLDDVATTIAKPVKTGGFYYFDVKAKQPENYSSRLLNNTSLSIKTDVGTTKYNSVKLSYYSSNAKYYNIYRYVSSTNSDFSFEYDKKLVERTSETTWTDPDVKDLTVNGNYIFYKVEAVGYYNAVSSSISRASNLATPVLELSDDKQTISWAAVQGAYSYKIYRAKTTDDLADLSEYDSFTTVYDYGYDSYSYSDTKCFSSDYVYAVRATDDSGAYSNISNVVTVKKLTLEAPEVIKDIYSYNGSTYTWNLMWDAVKGYSNSYRVLRYSSYSYSGNSDDEDSVKTIFENNPSSYDESYSSTSNTYYHVSAYSSSSYTYFYAIATREYDEVEGEYFYAVSDVYKIENTIDVASELSVTGSSPYTLTWEAIDTAKAYAVYCIEQNSSTLEASSDESGIYDLFATLKPFAITEDLTVSYTSESSAYYKFFVVVGLTEVVDLETTDPLEIIGKSVDKSGCTTNFVRKY